MTYGDLDDPSIFFDVMERFPEIIEDKYTELVIKYFNMDMPTHKIATFLKCVKKSNLEKLEFSN